MTSLNETQDKHVIVIVMIHSAQMSCLSERLSVSFSHALSHSFELNTSKPQASANQKTAPINAYEIFKLALII